MQTTILNKSAAAIISCFVFTALFYEQSLGMNVLMYGLLMSIMAVLTLNSPNHRLKVGIPFAIITIAAGFHGTAISHGIAIATYFVFAAQLASPRIEPVSAIGLGIINFLISPIRLLVKSSSGFHVDSAVIKRLVSFILIPLAFIFLFSILYASSNPIFEKMLEKIEWDFVNIKLFWVFILAALVSVVAFFFYVPPLYEKIFGPKVDLVSSEKEDSEEVVQEIQGDALMKQTWLVVIVTLSALLGFVLASDLYYRVVLDIMPEGLSYSSYLHRGVFSLILSIIFAIILITLIFSRKARPGEKSAALIFMILNAVFVIMNADKNLSYIEHYGLTIKRIGVFLYLFMTLLGIISTLMVVYERINYRSLVRVNSHIIFYSLILFGCFNWERTITRYNLSHTPEATHQIDYDYLFGLSYSNLDLLMTHEFPSTYEGSMMYKHNSFESHMNSTDFRSRSIADYILAKRVLNKVNNETDDNEY